MRLNHFIKISCVCQLLKGKNKNIKLKLSFNFLNSRCNFLSLFYKKNHYFELNKTKSYYDLQYKSINYCFLLQ